MSINEILKNALELPIDERVLIADILTQSLNTSNNKIEQNWEEEVNKRLELIDKGELETISYKEFFDEN
jgi:hypothetical protein